MSATRPSFRQKWLLPMATLTGAALVVFWGFYALDHLIAAPAGAGPVRSYFRFDPASIQDAVSSLAGMMAAVFGWDLLVRLGAFTGVVLLALGAQMFIVYPLLLKLFAGVSPLWFFRQSEEAMIMAFSTASSNATLPTAIRVAENRLNLPPRVARFVLTIGATANQNGR